jgi:ATP-dependent Clp protease ATP-binding subunit ClpA
MINNPEVEKIIEQAINVARQRNHTYVTLEHTLLSMITHDPFRRILASFGVDVDAMTGEVVDYLDKRTEMISRPDVTGEYPYPKKTSSLERMFNRAGAQVLFTGRRQIDVIDLYLSLLQETSMVLLVALYKN